jgi:hypothetical protein
MGGPIFLCTSSKKNAQINLASVIDCLPFFFSPTARLALGGRITYTSG